jgi:hypothetical protein
VTRRAAIIVPTLSLILSSCYSNGCGSERCLHQRVYADTKRCSAVFGASIMIVQTPSLPSGEIFDRGAIEDHEMQTLDFALLHGATLGMPRAAIYKDVEQTKRAYLQSYAAKQGSSRRKLAGLLKDVNACLKTDGL